MQFLQITPLELRPFLRFVIEPLAKLRAWRNLFVPQIYAGLLFGKPAGPQLVDQNPHAGLRRRLLIDALYADVYSRLLNSSHLSMRHDEVSNRSGCRSPFTFRQAQGKRTSNFI
jgi:hypothetical protein